MHHLSIKGKTEEARFY